MNAHTVKARPGRDDSGYYRIRIRGLLDPKWSDWFDHFAMTQVNGDSLLTGKVADQAALHGTINKIRNLGLVLLLVERMGEDE